MIVTIIFHASGFEELPPPLCCVRFSHLFESVAKPVVECNVIHDMQINAVYPSL